MIRIAVLAALPQEYLALIKCMKQFKKVDISGWTVHAAEMHDRAIRLVETGMGQSRLDAAVQVAMNGKPCDLILSMGFAGALHGDLAVGDVVYGERVAVGKCPDPDGETRGEDGTLPENPVEYEIPLPPFLTDLMAQNGVRPARVVTYPASMNKKTVCAHYQDCLSVIDMESSRIAEIARRKHVPFLSIRSISDTLEMEVDFDPMDLCGKDGVVNPLKACWMLVRRPSLAVAFHRLLKHSTTASLALARVVNGLLTLGEASLWEIIPPLPVLFAQQRGRS